MGAAPVSFGKLFDTDATAEASLSRYASAASAARHRHEQSYVCLVLAGGFIQHSSASRCARTGDLVVMPAGRWHSDEVGPSGALCLNLHLDERAAEQLLEHRGPARPVARRLAGEIAVEIAAGVHRDPLVVEGLLGELTVSLDPKAGADEAPRAVGEVLRLLEDAPTEPWRLHDLAMRVGLHPTHLARAFRRRTGSNIGTFRRSRVLADLCLELRSGERPLAELASAHGFADQPHMSRVVRRFTGFAPAAYRQLFRVGR